MSWTKRQFVNAALEEIGIASYTFDIQPEQYQSSLRRLDTMMAQWNFKGVRLGYPLPSSPTNSDLDQDSNVPDSAYDAIILNLAVRLAPSYGKVVSNDTKANAKIAYDSILSVVAQPIEKQLPNNMPAGAGNKSWRDYGSAFIYDTQDPLLTGNDGELNFE